jgi:hypothetical protein
MIIRGEDEFKNPNDGEDDSEFKDGELLNGDSNVECSGLLKLINHIAGEGDIEDDAVDNESKGEGFEGDESGKCIETPQNEEQPTDLEGNNHHSGK